MEEDVVKMLAEQMVTPVLWDLSMQQAISDGCTECGPERSWIESTL